jgi:tetratricopeptide (TPR) repeat protein
MGKRLSTSESLAGPLARPQLLAAAGLIVLATFVAYLPAVRGGFLWDDDAHVTKPELRSLSGLYRIWFKVGATQQYYPLLHSAFWIEHQLWGDGVIGYHLVNIALHACAAVMVMFILRRLLMEKKVSWADPAAFLTAAVFALHPVHVESVAWITEQKNTLSAVFYLAAMMTYLRFDRTRRRGLYLWATALFIGGLLTKTVTASLPAALLVIFWWQRGKLSWKRDVLPLMPWLALGLIGGLFTAWVEHDLIGAKGQAFELSAIQRFLLAGRVVWFYLSKLFWPAELIFIYPRWTVDASSWRQWLFPLGLIALFMGLLILAKKCRAPLAALLFFVGSLLPVLGFFNVFPFLYSFVADHFQYLASLGVIALACGGGVALLSRVSTPAVRAVSILALPAILGVVTFRQCRMYADVVTLYQSTIDKNPGCWLAHNNLGLFLSSVGRYDEAIASYQEALRLRPATPESLGNLATALVGVGRFQEAIDRLQEALRYIPDGATLHSNLGGALVAAGRPADAIAEFRRALELAPDLPGVRAQLDLAVAATQTPEAAISTYQKILRDEPGNTQARFYLGVLLTQAGHMEEAIDQFQKLVQINADHFEAQNNLALLLSNAGRLAEAIPHFEEAVRLRPGQIEIQMNLAGAYMLASRYTDAVAVAQRARLLADSAGQADVAKTISAWIDTCRARAETSAPNQ